MKSQGTKESRNRGVKWLARILESSNPGILLLLLAAAAGASPDTVEVRCVTTYDGPESREDRCTGMLVAPDGSVYLAGYSFGTKTDFDFAVLKVDTTGRIVWTSRFGSPLGCEDRPWCLARDSAGDIVAVGGSIADMAKMWDFRIVKYRPNGDTAWARLLDFPSHAEDKIAAAGILPDNSIIVTGTSRNRPAAGRNLSNDPLPSIPSPLKGEGEGEGGTFGPDRTDWDVVTARYAANGDTLWTRRYDGPAHKDDYGTALALDRDGNCYVAGKAGSAQGTDALLLKYDIGGRLLWQRTLRGDAAGANMAQQVLVDGSGRVWVFGACYNKGRSFDYLAACFDSSGRELARTVLDGARSVDICQAACLDRSGNVYATGQSTGKGTSFDVLTVKLAATGETLWTRRFHGTGADRGWCIGLDQQDRVVVGATSDGPTGQPDMKLLCYTHSGELAWTFRYAGGGSGEARPVAIAPCGEGAILVAGFACCPETDFDYLLLRLAEPSAP